MATAMSRAADRRHVRVHGAEVSTDGDSIGAYAEAIAAIVALVALLAAAWLAAVPSEGADLTRPASAATPANAGEYTIAEEGTAVQPDPDGPQEVAVFVPSGAAEAGGATFGNPFGTGDAGQAAR